MNNKKGYNVIVFGDFGYDVREKTTFLNKKSAIKYARERSAFFYSQGRATAEVIIVKIK